MMAWLRQIASLLTFGLLGQMERKERSIKAHRGMYLPTGNPLADRYRGVRDEPRT